MNYQNQDVKSCDDKQWQTELLLIEVNSIKQFQTSEEEKYEKVNCDSSQKGNHIELYKIIVGKYQS